MVGLLFSQPEVREEIIRGLDYFHHRSGAAIDFYCAGYSHYGNPPTGKPVSNDDPPWMFSVERFNQFRAQIERLSSWKHSGEADLILVNALCNETRKNASLDFSSAIVCDLNRMVEDGAIKSVRRFFEEIFRFADTNAGNDPTWGISDQSGIHIAGSALKDAVLSLLPKTVGDNYRRAEHFVVRDISK